MSNRSFLSALVVSLCVALAIGASDAQAKRLGGGRSVGKQSDSVMQRQATPQQAPQAPGAAPQQGAAGQPAQAVRQPAAPQAGAAAQPARNRFLGPIAAWPPAWGWRRSPATWASAKKLASFMLIACWRSRCCSWCAW